MIDDKPYPLSLPLLWSWGAGGVSRPPNPRRSPMAKMSLILFMFFLFSGGQVTLARAGLCQASCCWSSYSLIAELYVAGFLPSFDYPYTPPGLSHSQLVSVIEAMNIAAMFDGCCHWWRYWRLMVRMEYWGTPLIIKKLLSYPKWMQSRMNRRLPGCAGRLSGPVTLGNRLLPLLISKRTCEGTCTITSISNPNSSMMLKTTSCWYCS
jgi:hypothetical protein